MGHCYHHALSSVRKWGGVADDYIALHSWFDESKSITADFRHRALRHHAEGIFMLERLFGVTVTISTGRVVPVRLIGEQHVIEDLGFVPSFVDWVRSIRPQPWMGRAHAAETLAERAHADGIEVLPLIPALGDFNDDLRQLGRSALADGVRTQIGRADAERFLILHESSQAA